MFCSKCGREIVAGSAFCGGCGSQVGPALRSGVSPARRPFSSKAKAQLIGALILITVAAISLKPVALLFGAALIVWVIYVLPKGRVQVGLRLTVAGVLVLGAVAAQVAEVVMDRREEQRHAAQEQQRAAQEQQQRALAEAKKHQLEAEFQKLTPAEHLARAKQGLDASAAAAVVAESFRHLKAIPSSAPEAAEARRVEARLVRQQHLMEARRLIDASSGGDLESSYNKLKQAGTHITAVLKGNPNDREAVGLLALATAKGKESLQRDDDRVLAESKAYPQGNLAVVKCEGYVAEQLKAPSTAKFASVFSGGTVTEDLGKWRYRVTSYVDAQNSFGAMLRTHFTCEVQCVAKDRCAVTRLKTWDSQ